MSEQRESRKLPQNSYIYYTDKHHIGHMPENCVQPLLISFHFMLLYCCAQHYNIPCHSFARSPSHTHCVYNVHVSRLCSNVHTTTTTITGWNVCIHSFGGGHKCLWNIITCVCSCSLCAQWQKLKIDMQTENTLNRLCHSMARQE